MALLVFVINIYNFYTNESICNPHDVQKHSIFPGRQGAVIEPVLF